MNNLHPLFLSVNPNIISGYGQQTNEFGHRLVQSGLDIVFQGRQWYGKPGILVVPHRDGPRQYRMVGQEDVEFAPTPFTLSQYHMKAQQRNLFMSLWDIWDFGPEYAEIFKWVPYCPIDAPMTPKTYNTIKGCFDLIAMSKFGQKEFEKAGLESTYIPHGIDTSIFHPVSEDKKKEYRRKFEIPEDAFVIMTVGRNYYNRKRLDLTYQAVSAFIHKNGIKDCYLSMHTERNTSPFNDSGDIPGSTNLIGIGYNLEEVAERFGIKDKVIFPNKFGTTIPAGLLAQKYCTADVYCSTSEAEGFNLCIVEAQACGIPAIVPDNSAQPEHVEGHGWIVPCTDVIRLDNPHHPVWGTPDINKLVEAFEDAYNNRDKLKHFGEKADFYTKDKYDFNTIHEYHWLPFLKNLSRKIKT